MGRAGAGRPRACYRMVDAFTRRRIALQARPRASSMAERRSKAPQQSAPVATQVVYRHRIRSVLSEARWWVGTFGGWRSERTGMTVLLRVHPHPVQRWMPIEDLQAAQEQQEHAEGVHPVPQAHRQSMPVDDLCRHRGRLLASLGTPLGHAGSPWKRLQRSSTPCERVDHTGTKLVRDPECDCRAKTGLSLGQKPQEFGQSNQG
jgi:hypothetical protein